MLYKHCVFFFFNDTATTEIYTLSLHDALPIFVTGMSVIVTGVFMMSRVRTIFFPRNPYLFSDMTWGLMYVLHGLAGVGLIALVMVHVYFAVRPEKLDITKSMVFGTMRREFYLSHYDPQRWHVDGEDNP